MNKALTGSFHRILEAPKTTMAKPAASKWFSLFFLSVLCRCSSGTLVGFSYHASGNTTSSSPGRTLSFLKQNKISPSQIRLFVEDPRILRTLSNTGVAVDLYLKEGHVQNTKSASISGMKSYIMTFLSQVKIKSITVTSGNDYTAKYALPMLLSTLKSIHSVLSSFPADRGIKVSVAFPLSFLENVRALHERDLHRICHYIKEVRSSIIVEANIDGELSMGDRFVHSMIERASLAHSLLPCKDVPMVMIISSPAAPSAAEVAAFTDKVSKALVNNTQITNSLVGLYAQVSSMEDFAQKEMRREEEQIFPSSRRELSGNLHLKTTLHEATIFPSPIPPTPPIYTNPYIPTPTIVTIPSTNPVTTAPYSPLPTTSPITVPSTNPVNTPEVANPITAPPGIVPGSPVVTNPVTTYPPPTGAVPVTTPVTNSTAPPATSTNAPAISGQSWCVAKNGATETALQAGLDYACGMGKVDCSQLQQGGSCYNPNSLQNHASFAFNSYYQKNPAPTSCDFGGAATIVSTNPSVGSCTYLSSSSSSSSSSSTTPAPITQSPPVTTTPLPASTTPLAPAISGQSWCVAKNGATETALQAGLDYACGMGKVDCSQLQQGGSCYNPNSLQNHASFAFNSYYQKNPAPTSCDFGGAATIVSTNPSVGSCTYLSSSSSSSSSSSTTPAPITQSPPVTTTPLPASTTPLAPTTPVPTWSSFPPPGEGVSGSVPPPSVLNSSNPASSGTMPEFGIDSPPGFNSSTSASATLRPFVGYIILVTSFVTRKIIFNV